MLSKYDNLVLITCSLCYQTDWSPKHKPFLYFRVKDHNPIRGKQTFMRFVYLTKYGRMIFPQMEYPSGFMCRLSSRKRAPRGFPVASTMDEYTSI